MVFRKTILQIANAIFSLAVGLMMFCAGAYAVFALWDNQRIYAAAEDVQLSMIKLKPEAAADAKGGWETDFSQLLKVNPDVCGWLTVDNTNIDYPILQGSSNFVYLNTDVYGNFALAGSIFLDTRCSRDFADPYSLIYGHHMAEGKMFGDLDRFKEEDFFRENTTGSLILPNCAYHLDIFACLLVEASDDAIFEPTVWQDADISRLLSYAETNAVHVNGERLETLKETDDPVQILSLSTCSNEFTDARTIILAAMEPFPPSESGGR